MRISVSLMLIVFLFNSCENSNQKVTDYKDSKGRVIKHIVTNYFSNGQYNTVIDCKDTNERIIKQICSDSIVKKRFELFNEWFVSKSIFCFDSLGRRTLWVDIIKRYNRLVDSAKMYEIRIEKEKHVYEYPTPNRMVEITYTFHTNNFDDTDWAIKPNTLKHLTITALNEKGDPIGELLYTKQWPVNSTNSVDSTQARESFPDNSPRHYYTQLIKDTSFDVRKLSKYYK